jgi:hypothetical protein
VVRYLKQDSPSDGLVHGLELLSEKYVLVSVFCQATSAGQMYRRLSPSIAKYATNQYSVFKLEAYHLDKSQRKNNPSEWCLTHVTEGARFTPYELPYWK